MDRTQAANARKRYKQSGEKEREERRKKRLSEAPHRKKAEAVRKVEPIRDLDKIDHILDVLYADDTPAGKRRYLLFTSGIWLGRRIGDLLALKVGDVKGKKVIEITEEKTKKVIRLGINDRLRQVYDERLADRDDDEYLFQSIRASRITGEPKPIDKRTALRDLKVIKQIGGFDDNYRIGTHTMRKTFGYWYYKTNKDTQMLRSLFNHSDERTTRIYIGIEDDEKVKAMLGTGSLYDK